jgi:hypothetical protein
VALPTARPGCMTLRGPLAAERHRAVLSRCPTGVEPDAVVRPDRNTTVQPATSAPGLAASALGPPKYMKAARFPPRLKQIRPAVTDTTGRYGYDRPLRIRPAVADGPAVSDKSSRYG